MKVGILGGGQLGKMILQNAMRYPIELSFLDPNPKASCAPFSDKFCVGNFTDYDRVLKFGEDLDYIGIEIENVNIEALEELERKGKTVVPKPSVLRIIQNKKIQKEFYLSHSIPTAPFVEAIPPFVNKLQVGGYDGKGVQVIRTTSDLSKTFKEAALNESVADIKKELAVVIGQNARGEHCVYDVVEQVFNPELNVLDYLRSPAEVPDEVNEKAKSIALKVVKALNSPGIFAVELFWNNDGSIWVNETAPRVHNSGHASIENSCSSQFDTYLRALLNLPFGDVANKQHCAMINLLGKSERTPSKLEQLDNLMGVPGLSVHWYGKVDEKKGRKMGHISLVAENESELNNRIEQTKEILNRKIIKSQKQKSL